MVFNRLLNLLTSLRLTVVCLFLAMILVFVGTLAQVSLGLYEAQMRYFQCLFVHVKVPGLGWNIPVFPGGYLLGGVLLVNLVAAHLKRFKVSKKKIGIFMVHGGLILLLLGQFATEMLTSESSMRLHEGEAKNYSEDFIANELVLIDTSAPAHNQVYSVPEERLREDKEISLPDTPFTLRVQNYWINADVSREAQAGTLPSGVTNGVGMDLHVRPLPKTTAMNERDLPLAIVEVLTPQGSLGTWLVWHLINQAQTFTYEGRTYELAMRFLRHYKPYAIGLLDFRHDKYMGTEIPKNFSSKVQIKNPASGEDREVLIYMNNPLRYGGETYYQGSFDERDDQVSILQVVRNPSWLTPYLACSLVGLGLVVQFMSHLVGFIRKRRPA